MSSLQPYILVALCVANHIAMNGSRVAVSLTALSLHLSPFVIGCLLAVYAFLPMMVSIWLGRKIDRIGVRRPFLLGAGANALGVGLPALFPGLPALWAAAALSGLGFSAFLMAAQNALGHCGGPEKRTANFSLLALGMSLSGTIAPALAGNVFEYLGTRAAFAALAVSASCAWIWLWRHRRQLSDASSVGAPPAQPGRISDLVADGMLRRILLANALTAMGWDLYQLTIPITGYRMGLSPSTIGWIMSTFSAAVFAVRIALPWLRRHMNEWQLIRLTLWVGGGTYVLLPFADSAPPLFALAFVLGLALGSSQPTVLSLLHACSPPGRTGEVLGLRIAFLNSCHVALPLLFGGLGAAVGMPAVFWTMAGSFFTGAFWSRAKGQAGTS